MQTRSRTSSRRLYRYWLPPLAHPRPRVPASSLTSLWSSVRWCEWLRERYEFIFTGQRVFPTPNKWRFTYRFASTVLEYCFPEMADPALVALISYYRKTVLPFPPYFPLNPQQTYVAYFRNIVCQPGGGVDPNPPPPQMVQGEGRP